MNKDYVSYDLALKLKKAGFDEPCEMVYCSHILWHPIPKLCSIFQAKSDSEEYGDGTVIISAVPLWQAQKWLREKKGMLIWTYPDRQSQYDNVLEPELTGKWRWDIDQINEEMGAASKNTYPTYEVALSAGIDAALKYLNSNKKANIL